MSVRDQHCIICPQCRDDTHLLVSFKGECHLTSDGTEDCGDHEWDGTSALRCTDCGFEGTVADGYKAYGEDSE